MNLTDLIRTRRSVRTFDGNPLTPEHLAELREKLDTFRNPYGIPVEFVLLDAKEHGLSSPVIKGESLYIAGKVKAVPHSEEAFGYTMEELVLFLWERGIGTTWIGGTMKRELFETAAQLTEDERMYCITPVGYPAEKMSLKETAMRTAIQADKRKPASELFFDGDFSHPLTDGTDAIKEALETVRLAPSAVNKQPWRIVRIGNAYHFFEKHSKGYVSERSGDMQKIDIGIALCHFMRMTDGTLTLSDPHLTLPADTEYIATVTV